MIPTIKMTFKFKFGNEGIEPAGTVDDLIIFVYDEKATFRFSKSSTTKAFIKKQGEGQYLERSQSALFLFPGMKQEPLMKHISSMMAKAQEAEK